MWLLIFRPRNSEVQAQHLGYTMVTLKILPTIFFLSLAPDVAPRTLLTQGRDKPGRQSMYNLCDYYVRCVTSQVPQCALSPSHVLLSEHKPTGCIAYDRAFANSAMNEFVRPEVLPSACVMLYLFPCSTRFCRRIRAGERAGYSQEIVRACASTRQTYP